MVLAKYLADQPMTSRDKNHLNSFVNNTAHLVSAANKTMETEITSSECDVQVARQVRLTSRFGLESGTGVRLPINHTQMKEGA
jgi:hypothetical protein